MVRVNVVGAGKVGRTLMALIRRLPGVELGDVTSRQLESAREAVEAVGAGRAAPLADMGPAGLWFLTVPDDRIAAVASDLAATTRSAADPAPVAVHCSGFLSSQVLSPLRVLGWKVASCHPVLSFADPVLAAQRFAGTYCGIEGDAAAATLVRDLMSDLGAIPFPVETDRKALYHAAAVFSNNFTVVLQAIATEAFAAAGVEADVAEALTASLLAGTAENVARLGPAAALTGPAARGDAEVLRLQAAEVAAWHPEAAEVYRAMSTLARRLKTAGTTLPGADGPARQD